MHSFSFTAIVKAGKLTTSDDICCSIQGLSKHDAESIASWLSLATGDDVHLTYFDQYEQSEIKVTYFKKLAELELIRAKARDSYTKNNLPAQKI